MSDEHVMRQRFQELSDKELAEVVGPLRSTYTPEAIEIAVSIIEERGKHFDPDRPEEILAAETGQDDPRTRTGVGGWLGILCVFMILSGIATIAFAAGLSDILSWILVISVGLYTFYAGVLIWRAHPRAAIHTQYALLAGIGIEFIEHAQNFGLATSPVDRILLRALFMASVAAPVAWLAYLHRSWRVRNTFPSFRQHWPRDMPDANDRVSVVS